MMEFRVCRREVAEGEEPKTQRPRVARLIRGRGGDGFLREGFRGEKGEKGEECGREGGKPGDPALTSSFRLL